LSNGICGSLGRFGLARRAGVWYFWGKRTETLEDFDMATILLLVCSNVFMTAAWYGHLKYPTSNLWKAVLISWLIASVEYCFQVPANRIGHASGFTLGQLKTIQEIITLIVFVVFAFLYFGEKFTWNYWAGFACLALAGFFIFYYK
jgi:uncharacterized protein (DUF486 family)